MESTLVKEFKRIVSIFRNQNVDVCVWKDISHVKNGISKDIDLYISNFNEAKRILVHEGYLITKNTKGNHDFLFHAFKKIERQTLHLHLYTSLFSGSSWLKQYNFEYFIPLLIDSSLKSELALPSKEIVHEIEWIRYTIKKKTVIDRILLKRSNYKIVKELTDDNQINNNDSTQFYLKKVFLRYPRYKLPLFYLKNVTRRLFPLIYGHEVLAGGKIIVIHGSDGSGKSTMIKKISEYCKSYCKIKTYTTGNLRASFGLKKKSHALNLKSIKSVFIAIIRLIITYKAKFYSKIGYVVFMDRWPTQGLNTFDGPRLKKKGILGCIEYHIYGLVPLPDLAIGLDPGIDILLKRNDERLKTDKETPKEIIERYDLWQNYHPKVKHHIYLKNISNIQADFNTLKNIILKETS